ncbi:hypothetical protein GCM10025876_28400 [Demequina litorisediminis]|uniref:ABC transmembrane type-1 domain-containing protein n=1 Tax=Demequina litorisediminis TaxID=1849022 RepID=A0ABQ6IGT6_9MICO|nr:hypothetical protein GCM10025876_28400 [Demequina litorisediminis]
MTAVAERTGATTGDKAKGALWPLLVESVKPYWKLLLGVVVFQGAQAVCNLYLPSLNADIIDNGVATGDIPYIWQVGGIMLALSLLQIVCAIIAVYFGAKVAMAVGRDLRGRIFTRVGSFSENEVQKFGAPSLITRSTNDVQQVQMLVLMACTLLVTAPFMAIGGVFMALHQDVALSWIFVIAIPLLLIAVIAIISRMVPHFQRMQKRIDVVNRVMREQAHRYPCGARLRARARGGGPLRRCEREGHGVRLQGRAPDGGDVPHRDARHEPVLGGGPVVWRRPRGERPDGGRCAHRVPHLPHSDPHVRDDGDLPLRPLAARLGLRRPHRRGLGHVQAPS